jgi:hypothetical protein
MNTTFLAALLMLVVTWLPNAAYAADPSPPDSFKQKVDRALDPKTPRPESESFMPTLPTGLNLAELDASTRTKYEEALRACFEYRISGYQHRKAVFEWQLLSAKCIFVVVVLLVLAGIWFSWLQFRKSMEPVHHTRSKAPPKEEVASAATEILASAQGIKVSSPILGVVILAISLLFFYLYLICVYPISELL